MSPRQHAARSPMACSLALSIATGCSVPFEAPARVSGPSESQGVRVQLLSQNCEGASSGDPDSPGSSVAQLRVKVAVANGSGETAQFAAAKLPLSLRAGA